MKRLDSRYTGLIRELALADFKIKYQGSFLGYLWSLLSPMVNFVVLYFVFSRMLKVGLGVPHYAIYLLVGILTFSFWGEATNLGMQSISSKGHLIRKVYFPRGVLVVSSTLTSLLTFGLNMLVLLALAAATGVRFGWSLIYLPILMLELYVFVLGVSFYLGAVSVNFRDISHLWQLFNQVLFYATPIFYPMTMVPAKIGAILVLSPLTQVIQDARAAVIGVPISSTGDYWGNEFITFAVVVFVVVSGHFVFQRMASRFAEEV